MITKVYPNDSKKSMMNDDEKFIFNPLHFYNSTIKSPNSLERNNYNNIQANKIHYLELYSEFE